MAHGRHLEQASMVPFGRGQALGDGRKAGFGGVRVPHQTQVPRAVGRSFSWTSMIFKSVMASMGWWNEAAVESTSLRCAIGRAAALQTHRPRICQDATAIFAPTGDHVSMDV